MKIKNIFSMVLLISAGLFAFNCSSTQKKDEPVVEKKEVPTTNDAAVLKTEAPGPESIIEEANNKLKDKFITGYEKNQTKLNVPGWVSNSLPEVKAILATIPEGYSLLVEGHADESGSSSINQKISSERAKNIYDLLVANGVSAKKLKHQGFSNKYLLSGIDPLDGKNRRVTFKVVKQ
ncbi:MAG: OmpA family protein [Spirochaetia bacterium]|nr:OmpA family protein [Spirochaetia bacterium]